MGPALDLPIEIAGDAILPGQAFLADTPALRSHTGTQPDLLLRWNRIPLTATTIDVVVHLHGFSQQRGEMQLLEKLPRSGLELAERTRSTLALLPRGNWLGRTWYDFPALLDGGLDDLVDYALAQFSASIPLAVLRLDRLILTGHSGGGMPAIDATVGARREPDELHIFDGLYGRDPSLGDPLQGIETIDAWLGERFAAEPERPGALRVVYIEQQTGPFSRAVGDIITRRLMALDPELAALLAPRYRIERSAVPHGYVAAVCGPWLLTDPGADLDWSRV